MADLATSYMGLKLRNPVIVSSSDLTKTPEGILRCAEAGAGAVVMKSIYEEQFIGETALSERMYSQYPEVLDYLRSGGLLEYAPHNTVEIIEKTKKEVDIPVIASINCQSPRLWPRFARQFEDAGADGLELNIYFLPIDLETPGTEYEKSHLNVLEEVKKTISIPVAVKLTSQLTSTPYLVQKLAEAGCSAVVLFNWFLQPDINTERLTTRNTIGQGNFNQSLRWVALLSGRVKCDIASSGGVRDADDIIKQILAGASAVQVCSLFYQKGIQALKDLLKGVGDWMDARRYSTVDDYKGELSFKRLELSFKESQEAGAYFRAQYLKAYTKVG